MLSTYYYIYILVDTYYVINGTNIFNYVHSHNSKATVMMGVLSRLSRHWIRGFWGCHVYVRRSTQSLFLCNLVTWSTGRFLNLAFLQWFFHLGFCSLSCVSPFPFPPKEISCFWYADVLSVVLLGLRVILVVTCVCKFSYLW